ncbi:MAG: LEA type 2 family protein [Candidatus Coatesbacteria bacterium]|nr:MAG: LEA type 2 family protein [Candidatus Coatesbacteria bacterium]
MKLWKCGVAVAAVAVAVGGCGMVAKRKALKDCKFDLADVEVTRVTLSDVDLLVELSVYNPNDTEVIVDRFSYKLWSDKNPIAEGWHRKQEKVPPYEERVLAVTMKTPLKNLGKGALNQLRNRGGVTYTLQATVYLETFLGELEVPVTVRKKY